MKKQLLYFLFCISVSFNGWSQVSFTSFLANPVEQNKPITVNFTYSAVAMTDFIYIGVFKKDAAGAWLATIVESSKSPNVNFPVTSLVADTPGTYSINIPLATVPTASLLNGEYYEVSIQLYGAGWSPLRKEAISTKLTIAAAGTLGVETISLFKELNLYPNPVSHVLNFKKSDAVVVKSIKITNLVGQTVYSDPNPENINAIDVSKLSSGMYLLSVNSEEGIQQAKFYKK